MNRDQIVNAENDPRFQEEPHSNQSAEVARERLVVPADLQSETKALTQQVRKAQETVRKNIAVSVSPSNKLRRNGPCLCGSGKKFKNCCLKKIKDDYIEPVSLSGSPQPPTRPVAPTRKLRKEEDARTREAEEESPEEVQETIRPPSLRRPPGIA